MCWSTMRASGCVRSAEAARFTFPSMQPRCCLRSSRALVAVDLALQRLAKTDERKSRVFEMRFFGGLTVKEAAEVLGVAPNTVIRDWDFARAWLRRELGGTQRADRGPLQHIEEIFQEALRRDPSGATPSSAKPARATQSYTARSRLC